MLGFLKKKPCDFDVEFADGSHFTACMGTWDQVPRDRIVTTLTVGGIKLEGFERYAFSWEAEARATIGGSRRGIQNAQTTGEVVALLAAGIRGEKARIVRIPKDPRIARNDQEFPARKVIFADHVWRMGFPIERTTDRVEHVI